jgi:DNA-directed RNA polymerase subunit RPC12/RpoP
MNKKVLIYDIETSPIIGYTWGVWEQNVIEVIEDWQILSVAWKWLGEKKTHVLGQDDLRGYVPGVNDDSAIVAILWDLFDEADIVVAHNGNSFDQKKSQARMMIRGLTPPSPYKQIDTKCIAKKYAAFTRNNLKHLANDLNTFNKKGDAGGFETWQGCLAGDKKAWATMKKYNKQDITTLEDLYLKLLPWMQTHPTAGEKNACPKCGSKELQYRGFAVTNVAKYRRVHCQNCGGWSRERIAIKDDKQVFVNIAG